MFEPLSINPVQVKFVKTALGYINLYNVGTNQRITLLADQFFTLFPKVSKNVTVGCDEISRAKAARIFGNVNHVVA